MVVITFGVFYLVEPEQAYRDPTQSSAETLQRQLHGAAIALHERTTPPHRSRRLSKGLAHSAMHTQEAKYEDLMLYQAQWLQEHQFALIISINPLETQACP